MSAPLELYHYPVSTASQQVRLALVEKKLGWTGYTVNLLRGDNLDPAYMRLNGAGVVPTLVHDGAVITNAAVIMAYVDETFEGPSLTDGDLDLIEAWIKAADEVPVRVLTYGLRKGFLGAVARRAIIWKQRLARKYRKRNPDLRTAYATKLEDLAAWRAELKDRDTLAEAQVALEAALEEVERTLSRTSWLAGEAYTLADTAWTPVFVRLEGLGLDRLWSSERRPHIASYIDRLKARESFEKAITDYSQPRLLRRQMWDALWRHEGLRFTLGAALVVALGLAATLLG